MGKTEKSIIYRSFKHEKYLFKSRLYTRSLALHAINKEPSFPDIKKILNIKSTGKDKKYFWNLLHIAKS